MKIWQVTENDQQLRLYWYATKKEAQAHAAQYAKDVPDGMVDIDAMNVGTNKHGIVRALNAVISFTCFNEG
jgi:hypothetical protein